MTDDEIMAMRSNLYEYFCTRSALDRIQINPITRDEIATRLIGRIYEENILERSFIIYPTHTSDEAPDPFVKKTGPQFEVSLLGIFSGSDERYFPVLWNAYVKWMHEHVEADIVLSFFYRK